MDNLIDQLSTRQLWGTLPNLVDAYMMADPERFYQKVEERTGTKGLKEF
jgi:hypothetical protein